MSARKGVAPVLALDLMLAVPVSSRAQDAATPPAEDPGAWTAPGQSQFHHRRHGRGGFGQNGHSAGPGMPTTGPALSSMVWLPWMRASTQGATDGSLSQDQLDAARAALLAHFDANGDGTITADELAAEQTARVQSLDTDGDGSVSREEMEASMPHHGPPSGEGSRGGRPGMRPGSQPTDPAAAAAIQKARQDLREATASGDKARIDAARKAFWDARPAASGTQPPPAW